MRYNSPGAYLVFAALILFSLVPAAITLYPGIRDSSWESVDGLWIGFSLLWLGFFAVFFIPEFVRQLRKEAQDIPGRLVRPVVWTLGFLVTMVLAGYGIHQAVVFLFQEDYPLGYWLVFATGFFLALLYLLLSRAITKIRLLLQGRKEEADSLPAKDFYQLGLGLVVCVVQVAVLSWVLYTKWSSEADQLALELRGMRVQVPSGSVSVISENRDEHQFLYSLEATWTDSIESKTYASRRGDYPFDPTVFLRSMKSVTVYVDSADKDHSLLDDSFLPASDHLDFNTSGMYNNADRLLHNNYFDGHLRRILQLKEELKDQGKGRKVFVPASDIAIDHHHATSMHTSTRNKERTRWCCYSVRCLVKNPSGGPPRIISSAHREDMDLGSIRRNGVTVYLDPVDTNRYYVDIPNVD